MPAPITTIDPGTARRWLDAGSATLIDVREPDEHRRERIPGSTLHPLSRFDAASLARNGRVILHCQKGGRSLEAAQRLAGAGAAEVASLAGGIEAWRAAGLPTERDSRAPLPIMRQVQIVVGTMVLATTILGAVVSPWFLALTAFFGAGLVFAGTTGLCGMAAVIGRLPWNRVRCTNCADSRC